MEIREGGMGLVLAAAMFICVSSAFAAADPLIGVSVGDYYIVKKGVQCGEYLEPGARCAISAFNKESGSYEMVVVQRVNNELKAKVLFSTVDEFRGCMNQEYVQIVRKATSSEVALLTDNIDAWKIVRDRMIADIELPEMKRNQDEARRAAEQKRKAGEARTTAYKEKVKKVALWSSI
jgi:DNA-binding protein